MKKQDPMYRLVQANPAYFKNIVTQNRKYNMVLDENKAIVASSEKAFQKKNEL